MSKIDDVVDGLLEDNPYDQSKVWADDAEYGPGDEIRVEPGDKVRSIYGEHWVIKYGTGDRIWTSEYEEDMETGMGRGMRVSYVTAVQKEGQGPWYEVEHDTEEYFAVTKVEAKR